MWAESMTINRQDSVVKQSAAFSVFLIKWIHKLFNVHDFVFTLNKVSDDITEWW